MSSGRQIDDLNIFLMKLDRRMVNLQLANDLVGLKTSVWKSPLDQLSIAALQTAIGRLKKRLSRWASNIDIKNTLNRLEELKQSEDFLEKEGLLLTFLQLYIYVLSEEFGKPEIALNFLLNRKKHLIHMSSDEMLGNLMQLTEKSISGFASKKLNEVEDFLSVIETKYPSISNDILKYKNELKRMINKSSKGKSLGKD
jgi:hypothetical protein